MMLEITKRGKDEKEDKEEQLKKLRIRRMQGRYNYMLSRYRREEIQSRFRE